MSDAMKSVKGVHNEEFLEPLSSQGVGPIGLLVEEERFTSRSRSFSGVFNRPILPEQGHPSVTITGDAAAGLVSHPPLHLSNRRSSFNSLAVLAVEHNPIEGQEWQRNFRRGSLTHSLEIAQAGWGIGQFASSNQDDAANSASFVIGETVSEHACEEDRNDDGFDKFLKHPTGVHDGFSCGKVPATQRAGDVHAHYMESQNYHAENHWDKWTRWLSRVVHQSSGVIAKSTSSDQSEGPLQPVKPKADQQIELRATGSVPASQDLANLPKDSGRIPSAPPGNSSSPHVLEKPASKSAYTFVSPLRSKSRQTYRELNMTMPSGW